MPALATLSQRIRHMVGDSFGAAIVEQQIEKALQEVRSRVQKPESLFYDPTQLFMTREWLTKSHMTATYDDLRAMAKNPIIGAIIQTRLNQIAAFCHPQQKDYDLGFRIESDDPAAQADEGRIKELTDWIYSMGVVGYGEPLLETFIRKFMVDSLVLDQACAEIIFQRNDIPAYAVPVDGATIRRLKASLEFPSPGDKKPWYCQVMSDQIVNEYTRDELIFAVRNPRTDVNAYGYGMSELETLIRTVSTIINNEKYNAGQLTQGGTSKGVLVVKGDADDEQFNIFKRDFREAIRNAASAWRPPVLRVGKDADIDWVTLDRSNRDMEYAQLFDFLVKQACGVYQMDPTEINWTVGQTGAQVVFTSNQQATMLASRERGLRPLLSFLASILNIYFIQKLDDRYRFAFVGFDTDRQTDVDLIGKEVTTFKTVNEVRSGKNLQPIPGGDVILNPIYVQVLTQMAMGGPPAVGQATNEGQDEDQYNWEDNPDAEDQDEGQDEPAEAA